MYILASFGSRGRNFFEKKAPPPDPLFKKLSRIVLIWFILSHSFPLHTPPYPYPPILFFQKVFEKKVGVWGREKSFFQKVFLPPPRNNNSQTKNPQSRFGGA